jgi:conjugal transfer ATP-binding protein TraC
MDTNEMLRKFQKKVAEVQSQIATREEKGDGARSDARHRVFRPRTAARFAAASAGAHLRSRGSTSRFTVKRAKKSIKQKAKCARARIAPRLYPPGALPAGAGIPLVFPLATDELDVHTKLNSAPLSSIFPFISFDLTSDRGILYGINRHNSSLILFDRFSLENYNSVTFAKSGAVNPTHEARNLALADV